jgi:MerR family transcriptional regulator, copper efflux regulator
MQVGELSARTGASVRSIRHYQRAGLLHASRRDNGYREFDAASIDRVRIIRDLLDTGFTVDEIGSLASCLYEPSTTSGCCARTVSLYRKKLARVEQQVETLVRLRRRLRERIATLEPC